MTVRGYLALIDDPRLALTGSLIERVARLDQLLDHRLRAESGIGRSQLELLLRLARTPDGRAPIGELGRSLVLTSGGVTRLVDRMEERGLVARQASTDDRRLMYVALTGEGRARLRAALPAYSELIDQLLIDPVGPATLKSLVAALASGAGAGSNRSEH